MMEKTLGGFCRDLLDDDRYGQAWTRRVGRPFRGPLRAVGPSHPGRN